jgi:hypothetical protein
MKKLHLLCLLPLLMAVGCGKEKVQATPQIQLPAGIFNGPFAKIHRNLTSGKSDTLVATIKLTTDATGNFAVTGDTSTVHAGSKGKFVLGYGQDLVFDDKTFSATSTSTKAHLNGDYIFSYDGGTFELVQGIGDTISYQYILTKSTQ